MEKMHIAIEVNGEPHEGFVKTSTTLLDFLRDQLLLTGTKKGCNKGECGSCTVVLNGKVVNACLVFAVDANGGKVITIEGLGTSENPHPLQKAFAECGAIQCGYCMPGMIMSASSLLERNRKPTDEDIKSALAGNLCRCGGYLKVIQSIKSLIPE